MPVRIDLPEVELNEELIPTEVWCQNDKNAPREQDSYPFPITEYNYMQPYTSIGENIIVLGGDDKKTVVAMDEFVPHSPTKTSKKKLKEFLEKEVAEANTMKGFMGQAPKPCVEAKRNFEKNYVPNVAYRKDNTMPASNLKEYLSKNGFSGFSVK